MTAEEQGNEVGIGLKAGLTMIRDGERLFNLGDRAKARHVLSMVAGSLEFFDGQKARNELTAKGVAELEIFHRHFEDVCSRVIPEWRKGHEPPRPPAQFLELFRTNGNNVMTPEAIANGMAPVRVVAVSDGARAVRCMRDLHVLAAAPPAGWEPPGGWGFAYWPTDVASSAPMEKRFLIRIVEEALGLQKPPAPFPIHGVLAWLSTMRFAISYPVAWAPGTNPLEVVDLTPSTGMTG